MGNTHFRSMDIHCNVSAEMLHKRNVISAYYHRIPYGKLGLGAYKGTIEFLSGIISKI